MYFYYKETKKIEDPRYRTCAKCGGRFRLHYGGFSEYPRCDYHGKIINGRCIHCDQDNNSCGCLCIAKVTWWERLTGWL